MVGLFFMTETDVPHKISKSNLELRKTFIIIDKHKREGEGGLSAAVS
jgi:hypothetical protein